MTDLEAEDIIVDEFKQPGERTSAGTLRAGEEVFQKYDRKLKEKEEVSHGTTMTLCFFLIICLHMALYVTNHV